MKKIFILALCVLPLFFFGQNVTKSHWQKLPETKDVKHIKSIAFSNGKDTCTIYIYLNHKTLKLVTEAESSESPNGMKILETIIKYKSSKKDKYKMISSIEKKIEEGFNLGFNRENSYVYGVSSAHKPMSIRAYGKI